MLFSWRHTTIEESESANPDKPRATVLVASVWLTQCGQAVACCQESDMRRISSRGVLSAAIVSVTLAGVIMFAVTPTPQTFNAVAHNQFGKALLVDGQYNAAIRHFQSIIDAGLNEGDITYNVVSEAHFNMSVALAELGRDKEARHHYREMVRTKNSMGPFCDPGWVDYVTSVYVEMGRYPKHLAATYTPLIATPQSVGPAIFDYDFRQTISTSS